MKLETPREALVKIISNTERITGKNLTLPVLKCVLLETKKSSLSVRATNLDLGIEMTIPARGTEEGVIAIPGSVLSSFLSNIPAEKNITLEVKEGNLSVVTSKNATVFKSLPHEDFPTLPKVSEEKTFSIHSNEFIRGLKAVWYSSSVSSMKPELSSVYVYFHDNKAVFVATDSFRLAEKHIQLKKTEDKAQDFHSILIPQKNIPEIIRTLEGVNDMVKVCVDKNQIAFIYEGLYLTSRVIDGAFPDYKQIIPQEQKTEVVALKQDLINALKLTNLFSDSFHQLYVKIDPKGRIFSIRTKNADVGEIESSVSATLTGEPLEMSFNQKYILDCFQSIDGDSVSLQFNGPQRPLVIRGVPDNGFLYLVMPMNR